MNKALIIAAAAVPVYAVLDIYRFVFWRSRSRLSTLQRGVNIVRYTNGKVRKVLVR